MTKPVEIVEYSGKDQAEFRRLNLEWLDKFNLTESHDLLVLDDPQGSIIDRGGYIWIAKVGEKVVGTIALMKDGEFEYELAKMCVAQEWQGKGISKLLLEICIKKARETKAEKLTLFSNHQLNKALKLYERYGFRHVEVKDSPFLTADIRMELIL